MMYRPWGSIDWILSLFPNVTWELVGVLGTEDRSTCALEYCLAQGVLCNTKFCQIYDSTSSRYYDQCCRILLRKRQQCIDLGIDERDLHSFSLMDELFSIMRFASETVSRSSSIILDISSFPKRFFFPMLRFFLLSSQVTNLVVLYTAPRKYSPESAPLYEDIEPWATIPGFSSSTPGDEVWVVSIGFLVESLRRHMCDNPLGKIKLLIPFPAPLSSLRRTWEAVADLDQGNPETPFEMFRVEASDLSSAFDRLLELGLHAASPLAFAPFGPKPISAAMCIYASIKDSSVYYPQPTVYHPEYSQGIQDDDPQKAITAYLIKYNGQSLYHE